MLAVAGIAAYVSYGHAYAVVLAHGESGITARLEPATIDGLVWASSMVILYAARHRVPVPCLARWLPGLGIAATLTANMAQGWSRGPAGGVVAAWPAISLVGSYELLVWLIRISGTAGPGRRQSTCVKVRPAVPWRVLPRPRSPPSGRTARATAGGPARRASPRIGSPGWLAILVGGQREDAVAEAGTVNDAAVAAYRLSVQAGQTPCRNASSPTCSDAHPAAGPEPGSRRPADIAAPGLARHPGHGLTARPDGISASGPAGMTRRFTQVPLCRANTGPREVHQPCHLQRARQELSGASWYEPVSGARHRLSAGIPSVPGE